MYTALGINDTSTLNFKITFTIIKHIQYMYNVVHVHVHVSFICTIQAF